ncbi:hypothetical protein QX249_10790 [Vibrio parahaemolyticus]|uniref:Uncharacterized protein n=1 Tax=Vibrio parahaemolyticus TaxID=670 RepID=A0AAW8PY69_VIBPH|nr:hypothetical protein [Vibrio parahaemolyticus]MDS1821148.1 hypothetical protein [Vibrio parahaemolyticus]
MNDKNELITKLNTLLMGAAEFKDEKCILSESKESLTFNIIDAKKLKTLWLETIIPEAKAGNPDYLLIVETLRDYSTYDYKIVCSLSLKIPSKDTLPEKCTGCQITPPVPSKEMHYSGKALNFEKPSGFFTSKEGWRIDASISSYRESFEPMSPLDDKTMPKIYFSRLECPVCAQERDKRQKEVMDELFKEL